MTVGYRDAVPEDAGTLTHLFARIFDDTFGHLYDPADYDAFMEDHSVSNWHERLEDEEFAVHIAEDDERAVGYSKLGSFMLPVATQKPAVTLHQLYVSKEYHGQGIADRLMDWTIVEARRRGAEELYLTVFTENMRARRFYERYGFEEVGPYKFMVGNQADEDIIMRLAL